MKAKSIIIFLLVFWLAGLSDSQAANITQEQALNRVKTMFQGQDVDYYLVEEGKISASWRIFVDCDPLKGWEHECYIVDVPKSDLSSIGTKLGKTRLRFPPNEDLTPLEVTKRINAVNVAPNVEVMSNSINQDVANRTYVVILSGGWNKRRNYQRYWNDCAFLYQALKRNYGVPQENFRILMADGTDPAEDMYTTDHTYISSPLDLDNDGVNDIGYAATKQNIANVLTQLASIMKRDDHLFFFVIDHGGSDDYISQSYICLWNETKIYDYELATYLKPLLDNNVSVNAVLGQCYSGGFVDDLSEIGCVVTTACSGSESSWACSDRYYDEFVYHWTCAINGALPDSNKANSSSYVNADANHDGENYYG